MKTKPPVTLSQRLLSWFDIHGRHDLPWQQPGNAYAVWVSEIMLQQTQVSTVIPYYQRFMQRFPDIHTLANATADELMHYWSGLGYYARARNLHRAAQAIVEHHGGRFPTDFDSVLALPGIGRSTAGAILAQAYGQRHAILDGNVKRVLARHHAIPGWPGETAVAEELWQWAEQHTPTDRVADYTQAIMDLGATLCRRSKPLCQQCPLGDTCQALADNAVADYPGRKSSKAKPVKQRRFLFIFSKRGEILLIKRPPAGIWGGLWCPPELEMDVDPQQWCQASLGLTVEPMALALSPIQHTFSHFQLMIHPQCWQISSDGQQIMEPSETLWYNTSQPESLGLAAPVKALLHALAAPSLFKNQGVTHVTNG